ncbi:hypothetical protein B0H19DRAFT_1264223 [Mycena capillaripes]|nr:hypothetical protein B0H19DRAFT_1264223 [Mycena capillaripes]
MQQLGGALHHLDISPHISALSTVFDLSLHPNLRTLAIRCYGAIGEWYTPEHFDRSRMFQVLLKAAPPTLEQLWLNPALPYRSFEWEALDALLSDPTRFPRLKSAVFRCTANDYEFLRVRVGPGKRSRAVFLVTRTNVIVNLIAQVPEEGGFD